MSASAMAFAVSKFEVTFDEWDNCALEGGCNGYMPKEAAGAAAAPGDLYLLGRRQVLCRLAPPEDRQALPALH